jgi:hypothetical protein
VFVPSLLCKRFQDQLRQTLQARQQQLFAYSWQFSLKPTLGCFCCHYMAASPDVLIMHLDCESIVNEWNMSNFKVEQSELQA